MSGYGNIGMLDHQMGFQLDGARHPEDHYPGLGVQNRGTQASRSVIVEVVHKDHLSPSAPQRVGPKALSLRERRQVFTPLCYQT